jgi:hypothetical protein
MDMARPNTRTTVDIPTDVYFRLKEQAHDQQKTVRELILLGIDRVLHQTTRPVETRLRLPLIRSRRTDPPVSLTSEGIYGGTEFP